MRKIGMTLSLGGLAVLGACRGSDARPDDALKNDLALAAQAQPYRSQQFVSPGEQQPGANGIAPQYNAVGRAAQPVYRAPARRTASRSASRVSSRGGSYPSAPSAPQEPIRHTQRDAAIGAAAGAVIGATTSRDRVKGGLIGAAAGGILGGIIGHTVDVQKPSIFVPSDSRIRPTVDGSLFPLHERPGQIIGSGVRVPSFGGHGNGRAGHISRFRAGR